MIYIVSIMGVIASISLYLVEVGRWLREKELFSKKQKIMRTIMVIILNVIFVMFLFIPHIKNLMTMFIYVVLMCVLVFVLLSIVFIDRKITKENLKNK